MHFDILIKNGIIIDGSGGDPFDADIGIEGDTICRIKRGIPDTGQTIDANGLVVAPGFVDTHGHSEFTLLADGRAEGKILQGITTEINGNCGLSAAPLSGEALERREADLNEYGITERWETFREYFGFLENKGIALNVATLCGHGNLRGSVVGYAGRDASRSELASMRQLLDEALTHGARGLSTGLIYPPGMFSPTEELVALMQTGAGRGKTSIYATHMRSEGDFLIESLEETILIGREADCAVHVSHVKTAGARNWHKAEQAVETMESARKDGIRLTADRYPYTASSTDLDTLFPAWVHEGGIGKELARLTNPDTRAHIRAELMSGEPPSFGKILISSVTKDENKWMEGKSAEECASAKGMHPADFILDLVIAEKARVGAIFFSMNEENLRRFLSLPYVMMGTDSAARSFDGPTNSGTPHPRGFGSFPRLFGLFIRDEKLLSLPEAVQKTTFLAARTFGLEKRGLVKEGFHADIVIFDPEKISDRATFSDPFQKPEGIEWVFVNGIPAVRNGEATGAIAGRILR